MTEAKRGRGRPPAAANVIDRLELELMPVTAPEVDRALEMLIATFPTRAGGGPFARMTYRVALDGISSGGLDNALKAILQGRDDEIDPKTLPTPAELARLCRRIDDGKRFALAEAKAELAARKDAGAVRKAADEAEPPEPAGKADGGRAASYAGGSAFQREAEALADQEAARLPGVA